MTVVMLSGVQVQHDQDLLRARRQLMQRQVALRKNIRAVLSRYGSHYKAQTQRKTHWRKHHFAWLDTTAEGCRLGSKTNPSLPRKLKRIDDISAARGEAVRVLVLTPSHRESVKAIMAVMQASSGARRVPLLGV